MIDLEGAAFVCQTRPENADPDLPHCEGTCLVLIRVPVTELPKMVTIAAISIAEATDLGNAVTREVEKSYRYM